MTYILCPYAAVHLYIYTCSYVNACVCFYAHVCRVSLQLHCSEFQLQPVPARPGPRRGWSASRCDRSRWILCLWSKCGNRGLRERKGQRGRRRNINGGIKRWWQQKMAARSYMVLMDLFTVCEKGREEREKEAVCRRRGPDDVFVTTAVWSGRAHMRPTSSNNTMIPALCIRSNTCHDATLIDWFFLKRYIVTF